MNTEPPTLQDPGKVYDTRSARSVSFALLVLIIEIIILVCGLIVSLVSCDPAPAAVRIVSAECCQPNDSGRNMET